MPDSYPATCPACSQASNVTPPRHSKGGRMGAAKIVCPSCNAVVFVRWARSADDRNVREEGADVASAIVYEGATTKVLHRI